MISKNEFPFKNATLRRLNYRFYLNLTKQKERNIYFVIQKGNLLSA